MTCMWMRTLTTLAAALCLTPALWAAPPWSPAAPEVSQALQQGHLPAEALGLWIQNLEHPELGTSWQAQRPLNPASLTKLATSLAALDQLGPQWTWHTPVWLRGRIDRDSGLLDGDLVIQGRGDPKLVLERLWLLLRQVQTLGVRDIHGRIVLDRSRFALPPRSPSDFDGEGWHPGNVQADALLLNYKTQIYRFTPSPQGVARISAELPLAMEQTSVPLKPGSCQDWRAQLQLQWVEGQTLRFAGSYPASCGELRWPLADPDPASFNARLLAGLWQAMGGRLSDGVVEGPAPDAPPSFEFESPPLAEVLRDINKYSNNLMAEQLLLSASAPADGSASTPEQALTWLSNWLKPRLRDGPGAQDFVLDNGSGLSRQTRLSAAQLGQLLHWAWQQPFMPEFVASLPIAGLDGTLSRAEHQFGPGRGRAHLKTGSLRDVNAVAGYVQGGSGQHWAMVAILNDANAAQGRPVLDALVRWVARDLQPETKAAAKRP
ncbi:MAG: D-alanyl-D-alanine carboxypeptidase/D-alanyl-D-alanine-endopeptidase [Burkholderiaceae bacterium]|nr:D-alanyl-D-alanine carboxypeptidase/D-alanyl-D-alanine-endopeptidase [Burkholderiaceae bacterium]